jgi:hypothetical protein
MRTSPPLAFATEFAVAEFRVSHKRNRPASNRPASNGMPAGVTYERPDCHRPVCEHEQEIGDVVTKAAFQDLSREISQLLAGTPKREVYEVL